MIAKHFNSSSASAGVSLEKVIRNIYEMFRHKTSTRKPFFSKVTWATLKKNLSINVFLEKVQNFEKCPEKNKNFQGNYLLGLVSINDFTNMF